MDQGIQGRLKNPAGLQVYSDLERLGEKHKTKTEKEKKNRKKHKLLTRTGWTAEWGPAVSLGRAGHSEKGGPGGSDWGEGLESRTPCPLYLLYNGVTFYNNLEQRRNKATNSARRVISFF